LLEHVNELVSTLHTAVNVAGNKTAVIAEMTSMAALSCLARSAILFCSSDIDFN
jgi:hypothetical protein